MDNEQKQRIEQIRNRHEHGGATWNDIDFLLSIVKGQEAESKVEQNGRQANLDHLDSTASGNRPDRLSDLALHGEDQISNEVDLYCPDCKSEFRGSSSNIGLIHSCDNQLGSSSGSRSRIRLREQQYTPDYVWLEPKAADFYSVPLSGREIKYVNEDSMRSLCVEKVREKIADLSRTNIAAEQNALELRTLHALHNELESLTLQEQEAKQS